MLSIFSAYTSRTGLARRFAWVYIVTILAASSALGQSCTYGNCSNGSDGAFNPTQSGYFIAANFHGTGVANNVFNFTTITIPANVTITFDAYRDNAPVYWFASGNVDIEGTLQLSGDYPFTCTSSPDNRVPLEAGAGGYGGGVGSGPSAGQNATAGSGPGGGAPGTLTQPGGNGTFTGNYYLTPLVGGSGGGGCTAGQGGYGQGGGSGGGAILIASSTQITVNGSIAARGGVNQECTCGSNGPGWGSGGAVRLVSNTITGSGNGSLLVDGGYGHGGNSGLIRLEGNTLTFSGQVYGSLAQSPPYTILYPTTPQPVRQSY